MDFRNRGFRMDNDTVASLNETADMLAKMFGVDLGDKPVFEATEKTAPTAKRDFGAEMDEAMKSLTEAKTDAEMESAYARIRQIKSDLREAQVENAAQSRKLEEAVKVARAQWDFIATFYPAQTAALMQDKNFDPEVFCRNAADEMVADMDRSEKLIADIHKFADSFKPKATAARDKIAEAGSDALDKFAQAWR